MTTKLGRPSIPANDRRAYRLVVLLKPSEARKLRGYALALNQTVAAFVREALKIR